MMWRLALSADASVADAYAQVLEPMASVVSIYETDPDPNPTLGAQPEDWATDVLMSGLCVVEALFEVPPETDELAESIAEAAQSLGQALPPFSWEMVEDQDWVGLSQSMNPAIRARGIVVKPSHVDQVAPARFVLNLDAGRAFGSGSHNTTFGCLMVLQQLGFTPRRVVDIGTGSGLLAIAAAKLFRNAEVVASEIDARALDAEADAISIGQTPPLVNSDLSLSKECNPIVCSARSRDPLATNTTDCKPTLKHPYILVALHLLIR